MAADEREQLAAISAVASEADRMLARLEANVAELKAILGRLAAAGTDETRKPGEAP